MTDAVAIAGAFGLGMLAGAVIVVAVFVRQIAKAASEIEGAVADMRRGREELRPIMDEIAAKEVRIDAMIERMRADADSADRYIDGIHDSIHRGARRPNGEFRL